MTKAEQRDGYYLLPSNLTAEDPAVIWSLHVQLNQIEAVFRSLKSELGIRPIYHQKEDRIDAHIFIAFLAYCLQVTLKNRAMAYAPGLTPQAILEKLSAIQMIDVCFPTCDGRWLILPRYTQPDLKTTSSYFCITCTWNLHLNRRRALRRLRCRQPWPEHETAFVVKTLR